MCLAHSEIIPIDWIVTAQNELKLVERQGMSNRAWVLTLADFEIVYFTSLATHMSFSIFHANTFEYVCTCISSQPIAVVVILLSE